MATEITYALLAALVKDLEAVEQQLRMNDWEEQAKIVGLALRIVNRFPTEVSVMVTNFESLYLDAYASYDMADKKFENTQKEAMKQANITFPDPTTDPDGFWDAWGEYEEEESLGTFDLVHGVDIVYEPLEDDEPFEEDD